MTNYVQIPDKRLFSMRFFYEENPTRFFFVAKQQAASLSLKYLDMLLHAQQVMPPNKYICDVKIVRTLNYKENPTIPNKKRNAPLKTVQLSGRSQVICQFSLYQCKGMSGTAASHVFYNQASKLC